MALSPLAMSPLQYQNTIRLMRGRSLPTAGGKNVTAAAFEVGYESPTQFGREYVRTFGMSPARDAVRIVGEMRRVGTGPAGLSPDFNFASDLRNAGDRPAGPVPPPLPTR